MCGRTWGRGEDAVQSESVLRVGQEPAPAFRASCEMGTSFVVWGSAVASQRIPKACGPGWGDTFMHKFPDNGSPRPPAASGAAAGAGRLAPGGWAHCQDLGEQEPARVGGIPWCWANLIVEAPETQDAGGRCSARTLEGDPLQQPLLRFPRPASHWGEDCPLQCDLFGSRVPAAVVRLRRGHTGVD